MWDAGRHGIKLGAVIFGPILLTAPSIYLLESFLPLLIGGPLIVVAAFYSAIRATGPGGELDQGYARLDRAMKPLGLQVIERPQGGFISRRKAQPGDWLCDLWVAERLLAG
jgi:hypothetical protein